MCVFSCALYGAIALLCRLIHGFVQRCAPLERKTKVKPLEIAVDVPIGEEIAKLKQSTLESSDETGCLYKNPGLKAGKRQVDVVRSLRMSGSGRPCNRDSETLQTI